MEPMKPREDYLLKMDILQHAIRQKVKDFLGVEKLARAAYHRSDPTNRRELFAIAVQQQADDLDHMCNVLREQYEMHGSFTPGVGTRDE